MACLLPSFCLVLLLSSGKVDGSHMLMAPARRCNKHIHLIETDLQVVTSRACTNLDVADMFWGRNTIGAGAAPLGRQTPQRVLATAQKSLPPLMACVRACTSPSCCA